jgi:AcrR family transcriptional regulator
MPALSRRASYHHGDLKAALIAAAEELITEAGTAQFTLRECARRAGVSPAAPAHHFGNLLGLLEALATLGFEELARSMEDSAGTGLPPAARIRAMGEAYVRFALQSPGRFRVTFGEKIRPSQSSNAALREAASRAFGLLESEVARLPACAREPGSILPQTVLLWSMVHGLATLLLDQRLNGITPTPECGSPMDTLGRAVLDQLERLCIEKSE